MRAPFSTPITPLPGSLFHADLQRVDSVLGMRVARSWALIDGRRPHPRHQPPHASTPDRMAEALEVPRHLAAAISGMIQERGVDRRHQRQHLHRLRHRRIVEGRPADRHQPALRRDRQAGMRPLDHLPSSHHAHRANPFDQKSRSFTSCPILACSFSISLSPATFAASFAPEKVYAMPSIA